MKPGKLVWLLAILLGGMVQTWAADVIIVGSGGESGFSLKFADWAKRLRRILIEDFQRQPAAVHLFLETANEAIPEAKITGAETLRAFFKALAEHHRPDENLIVYLIGHGSFLQGQSKFQTPGPDLSAEDFKVMLDDVPRKRLFLIQTASAGAGFINVLSGPDAILCSATRSAGEQNATEFMEFFLQGIEDGSADQNRDERISMWEACAQAAALTEAWYAGNGWIATEHAILDDNGDGLGTRLFDPGGHLPDEKQRDGDLAQKNYLKDFAFPPSVPKELVERYLQQIKAVERLKQQKAKLPEKDYYRRLEDHLLQAARIHREIRKLSQAAEPRPE